MPNKDYSTTFTVAESAGKVFDAINNVRGWWSEEIEGPTDAVGKEFSYHFQDVHKCRIKVTELTPGRRVAWLVVDNYFDFVQDKSEWKGTEIVFDISRNGDQTEVRFTHRGLTSQYECYDVCANAWGTYIGGSLKRLISTGKGSPNPREETARDFAASFSVDKSPSEVFDAINNVRGWWSGEIEGETGTLGAEFTYRMGDLHFSRQKVSELVPGKKVRWHVTDATLSFVKDTGEWKGTDILFEIERVGGNTVVHFTHKGLVPDFDCYDSCSSGWGMLVKGNLRKLITTGKVQPSPFTVKA